MPAQEEPIFPFQASFAHGEISPFLYGRVDLQAFASALATSRNAFIRTEGSWSNRPGLQFAAGSLTSTSYGSVLIPFTFNVGQAYIIEISASGLQVFFQGAAITSGSPITISSVVLQFTTPPPASTPYVLINTASPHGLVIGQNVTISGIVGDVNALAQNGNWTVTSTPNPTTFRTNAPAPQTLSYTSGGTVQGIALIASPYLQSELAAIRYSQSADTLTMVHKNHPPYEFKRISASTFTFLPAVYNLGPFLQQNSDGTSFVYASAQSGTVTLNSTVAIFNANHVGALFQLTQQDLSQIPPWEPNKILTGSGLTAILGLLRRSNGKNYKCVGFPLATNPSIIATGSVAPSHSQGTQSDGDGNALPNFANAAGVIWQYTDSGVGVVKITQYNSATQVIGVVQPNYIGGPGVLPLAVVGGPIAAGVGPWSFTGDGATTSFALGTSTATDPNRFVVKIAGVYQQPSLYTISGTNIIFLGAPANGAAISVTQITALGQTTFWNFGAFSADQGYPSAVTYVPDRLILAATPQQPVGVFGSQTSQYHNFGVSNPIVNSDAFAIFLNARQLNSISDLVPLQDLIIGTANIVWRLWPGSTGTALGPLSIDATPQAFVGESPNAAAVLYADSMIFATYGGRRIRDLVYQFQFDKYIGSELTGYSRHLVPFGTQIIKMQYAPDPWGLLYALRSDGVLLCCTYVREQQMIAWSRWDTQGTIEDIAVIPENNSYALYMVTSRTINGSQVRYIERLSQWETTTIYDYKFMDCSVTYDGRNTSATTMILSGGTSWLSGDVGTLAASSSVGWATFQPTDPGLRNQIQLFYSVTNADGSVSSLYARVLITDYVSATQVAVSFIDPIPSALQGSRVLTWTFARTTFGGAQQLAGMPVSVLADSNALMGAGGVPNITVDNGGNVTLPNACGVVCVGLQYLSDLETLPLNQTGAESLRMKAKSVPMIYLDVTGTRGLQTGTDFVNMFPIKERAFEPYLSPTNLQEGIIDVLQYSSFNSETTTCVRQPYPLPVTIRMVIPAVNVGDPVG